MTKVDSMADREDDKTLSRRGLLRRLAAGLGMAGASAAAAQPKAARSAEPKSDDGGYRETEHVRKVYAAART